MRARRASKAPGVISGSGVADWTLEIVMPVIYFICRQPSYRFMYASNQVQGGQRSSGTYIVTLVDALGGMLWTLNHAELPMSVDDVFNMASGSKSVSSKTGSMVRAW